MRSTDRDSQRIATCTSSEIDYLLRISVSVVVCGNLILNTCQYTQLTLNSNIILVCVLNNLLCQSDVLLIRQMRTIDHYRREAHIYARLTQLKAITVIQVQNDLRVLAA